jgi:hypothetical protein
MLGEVLSFIPIPLLIVDLAPATIVLFYGFGNILQTVPADEVPHG